MDQILKRIPGYVEKVRKLKDFLISNLVLIGQVPSPTFNEKTRSHFFMERLAEFDIGDCYIDDYGNPIGIIRGTANHLPPIFVVAHIDTVHGIDVEHNYTVTKNSIIGPGIADNSLGVSFLLSLPEILKVLNIEFESDIVLVASTQSMGKGNLHGIRNLLNTWKTPIRGAICVEGAQLGRLSYLSDGMIRGEIKCEVPFKEDRTYQEISAILVLNEVINKILKLRTPQRPKTKIIFGRINGGIKYGAIAHNASLGFELRSTKDNVVQTIKNDINDIIAGLSHENEVALSMDVISQTSAARLAYNHPLVKFAFSALETLDIKPIVDPSESELSTFLAHKIPAITLGISHAKNIHTKDAKIKIEAMFSGIAQIIGTLLAIDKGVCDEHIQNGEKLA